MGTFKPLPPDEVQYLLWASGWIYGFALGVIAGGIGCVAIRCIFGDWRDGYDIGYQDGTSSYHPSRMDRIEPSTWASAFARSTWLAERKRAGRHLCSLCWQALRSRCGLG